MRSKQKLVCLFEKDIFQTCFSIFALKILLFSVSFENLLLRVFQSFVISKIQLIRNLMVRETDKYLKKKKWKL